MPRYGNYQDPWAGVAQSANNALFKHLTTRPTAADQANMQKTQLETQLLQNRLSAPDNIAGIVGKIMEQTQVEGAAPSMDFVGPQPGVDVPLTPDVINQRYTQFAPELMRNAMMYSGDSVGSLGDTILALGANMGANDDQMSRAQLGAGQAFDKTIRGVNEAPFTLAPGNIRFNGDGTQRASAPFKPGSGYSGPSFSMTQPDGSVISFGGNDVVYGGADVTKPTMNDLQQRDIGLEDYQMFSKQFRDSIDKNPGSIGTRGNLARTADSVLGQVQQFAPGSDVAEGLQGTRDGLAGTYVDPQTGETKNTDLYSAASTGKLMNFAVGAIVGQSGKSLSDADRELLESVIGSPEDWLATPEKLKARLDQLDGLVGNMRERYQGRMISGGAIPSGDNTTIQPSGRFAPPPDLDYIDVPQFNPTEVQPSGTPQIGEVIDGYRYRGGNPADPNSWEQ